MLVRVLVSFILILVPVQAWSLNVDDARHLLVRTGFAASIEDVAALRPLSRAEAVDFVLTRSALTTIPIEPGFVADGWVDPRTLRGMSVEQRREFGRQRFRQAVELRRWWYREMIATPAPLTEMMTLFWHNHFTSSVRKTRSPFLMYQQNVLLREHAVGNFADLMRDIIRDPAMLIYLDTVRSRAGMPNENFARELLELFTLGTGHYSEDDIKEIARAFTGYSIDREVGTFRLRSRIHDGGEKTVLGHSGEFDGDDIVEILLGHPRTAETIVEKLWRQFISDQPDPTEVSRLADSFRLQYDYDIAPLLADLLNSDDFWLPDHRGNLIKSPVEFLVGTMRQFDVQVPNTRPLVVMGRHLGQHLFEPPNVKGWPGGLAWITSDTLLLRNDIVGAMIQSNAMLAAAVPAGPPDGATMDERFAVAMDRGMAAAGRFVSPALDRWLAELPPDMQNAETVSRLILPLPPSGDAGLYRNFGRNLLAELLTDPVYQLK